ncbi:MAG: hypothetical protein GY737_20230 [Desulfobacteraceae bacterium]|nr:hypothetical protein [Desulfobacteraceae bacterium]
MPECHGQGRIMSYSNIKKLVYQRTGLTFDAYRTMILREKISRQMTALDMDDMETYCYEISRNKELFDDLVDGLTINESYFYREAYHLDCLSQWVVPKLMTGETGKEEISILSAGCSTGEEPCSIAMALDQAHGPSALARLHISGVDIDRTALSKARAGIYGKWKVRQLTPSMLSRYFDPIHGDRFVVKPDILKKIVYYHHNLMDKPMAKMRHAMDFIFYRNVSIYFDTTTRVKVLSHLDRMLKPGGYLVMGATETLSHNTGQLPLVEMDGCFVYQKPAKSTPAHCKTGGSSGEDHPWESAPGPDSPPGEEGEPATDGTSMENSMFLYEKSLTLARQKEFDHALALLEPVLEKKDGMMEKAGILRAGLLIQKGDTETAGRLCRQFIETNPHCAPACLLLGMIAGMDHHPREGLKRFLETTHIDPGNWLAHFLMFQTYQALGNQNKASRQAAIVISLLEKGRESHHGLDYFPFSFSREDILQLCRKQSTLNV